MEWDKQTHKDLCEELHQTYLAKNKDYGNAFSEQIQEYGQVVSLIRIEEKFKRFKQLVLTEEHEVKDEKAFDTLLDMANYCLLAAMEYLRDADTADKAEAKDKNREIHVRPKHEKTVLAYDSMGNEKQIKLLKTSELGLLQYNDYNVELLYKALNDEYYKVIVSKYYFGIDFEEV